MTTADGSHPITPESVRETRFPLSRRGLDGYDPAAVDDFVDQVLALMSRGEDLGQLVHHARFPIVRSRGYQAGDVDEFVDRLVASYPYSGPPPTKQGFARLFG